MQLFKKHEIKPRTHFGQNFLIDLNIVEYIVNQAELGPEDVVLEVGAGTGSLTNFMAEKAGAVVSVELDPQMHQLAQESIGIKTNITLLHCDVLRTKNRFLPQVLDAVQSQLEADPQRRLKLISNLPFNIATPVVANLVATDLPWKRMVVTIQWELGLRMTAKPGQSHYGSLSVWLQSQCDTEILKHLPMTVFWPRPKVDSAIVRLLPDKHRRELIEDRGFFHDFVRRSFQHRRKFLRSVLTSMYRKQLSKQDVDSIVQEMQLEHGVRAEQLDVATLVILSNKFRNAIPQTT